MVARAPKQAKTKHVTRRFGEVIVEDRRRARFLHGLPSEGRSNMNLRNEFGSDPLDAGSGSQAEGAARISNRPHLDEV